MDAQMLPAGELDYGKMPDSMIIVGLRFSVSPFVHLNTAYVKAQGVWTDTSEE